MQQHAARHERQSPRLARRLALIAWLGALPAAGQNQHQPFQNFFTAVCAGAPTGSLSTRCDETSGDSGDLSGDSEVSLSPSQVLASHDGPRARSRELSQEIEERLAARRAATEETRESHPFAIILEGRGSFVERERSDEATLIQPAPLQIERGYGGSEWSVQAGGDARVAPNALVGGIFSYSVTDLEFDADTATLPGFTPAGDSGGYETESYGITLFGSVELTETLYVDGSLGGGWSEHEIERSAVFQEAALTEPQTNVLVRGDPDGWEFSATGGIGYDFAFGALSVGPYARGRYIRTELDGYSEEDRTGSGLTMRFERETRDSATSILGARASYALRLPFGVLLPQVRAEWEHEYIAERLEVSATMVQEGTGVIYTQESDRADRNFASVGGGFSLVLPRGWLVFADYEVLLGYEDFERHRVTSGVRVEL